MTATSVFDGKADVASWDKDALEAYARGYGRALHIYFSRRGAPPEHTEDLVQEVFTRLAALTQKGVIENGEAYLMRTASTVWIDFLRKKQRKSERVHFEYRDELHSPEGFSPERVLEGKETLDAVIEAMESLTARTRQVYLLCRIDGLRRKVVAKQLQITVSAVDKHLLIASKVIGLAVKEED